MSLSRFWRNFWPNSWRRPSRAAYWFERIRAGAVDTPMDCEFVQWLRADPRHGEALEARETAWQLAADLRGRPGFEALLADADGALRAARAAAPAAGSPPRRHAARLVLASAAVLTLAAGASFLVLRDDAQLFETGIGEQRVISLADHSTVSLNTATRLKVRYSRAARRIELLAGEAVFAVTHDASRPFEVLARGGVARAVGTRFDVRLLDAATEVAVLEGVVEVSHEAAVSGDAPVRVAVGQSVSYTREGRIAVPGASDANRILGWQSGRIVLSQVTLAAAIDEYNRYSRTRIVLQAPELSGRVMGGIFRIGDEDAFVRALEGAFPLRAQREADRITLRARNDGGI